MSDTSTDHSRLLNHALVAPAGVYEIDPVHTFLCFRAQHLVIGHWTRSRLLRSGERHDRSGPRSCEFEGGC